MAKDIIENEETENVDVNSVDSPEVEELAEPTKKRSYKPRQPKVQSETLDTNEKPVRKPRQKKGSIENTARQIEGIHKMIATIPALNFMALDPREAMALAEAMTAIAEEYDVQISGKAGATIQLIAAVGMIYVPRAIYAIGENKKAKKAAGDLGNNQNQPPVSPESQTQ